MFFEYKMINKYNLAEETEHLYKAFSYIKTRVELNRFFADLFTPQEIEEFAMRWKIIRDLEKGKCQRRIANDIGCSVTTVSRGSKTRQYGAGGFEIILSKLGLSSYSIYNKHFPHGILIRIGDTVKSNRVNSFKIEKIIKDQDGSLILQGQGKSEFSEYISKIIK